MGAASRDIVGDLCFLPLCHDMAFLRFNFLAGTMGSGVMAATVSTDSAGGSAMEVDGVGPCLPSHLTLGQRARHKGVSACPGHVDFVPGHINFCGYLPDRQVTFHSGHVLIFFSAVYISFTGLVQIVAGHMKIFARHINF